MSVIKISETEQYETRYRSRKGSSMTAVIILGITGPVNLGNLDVITLTALKISTASNNAVSTIHYQISK